MFGGAERRRSSNVRFKQLFHELKQQFPTISDEIIANCILENASSVSIKKNSNLIEALKASINSSGAEDPVPMGHPSTVPKTPSELPEEANDPSETTSQLLENNKKNPECVSPDHHHHHHKTVENKLSNLLLKQTKRISKGLIRSENSKKHYSKLTSLQKKIKLNTKQNGDKRKKKISKLHSLQYTASAKETESSTASSSNSSRETTPTPDLESESAESRVSSLRQQFESAEISSSNENLINSSSRSKSTPPNGSEMSQNAPAKRPTFLPLTNTIQPSEKCKNLPKLLNSNILSDKPPRSPIHPKKFNNNNQNSNKSKSSDNSGSEEVRRRETVSTPTQTSDTLIGDSPSGGGSVNLSFNVNCSMDLIQSTPNPRRATTSLQLTPESSFWLPSTSSETATSPRSYTSVNLTLRPPSSSPQPPIDITSQNASLTYSTSSFDSQKGLQSRLQITVGPSGSNVIASRLKPKEFDAVDDSASVQSATKSKNFQHNPVGCELDDEKEGNSETILKQQARIEHLRIELRNEKSRLIVLNKEISNLENNNNINNNKTSGSTRSFADVQKQELKQKIAHLSYQCQKLVQELNDFQPEFYDNLYRGQPLGVNRINNRQSYPSANVPQQQQQQNQQNSAMEWNCHICTFRNHPEMNKCEQCDMPRLIHVSAAPGDNIHIHVTPRMSRRIVRSWLL